MSLFCLLECFDDSPQGPFHFCSAAKDDLDHVAFFSLLLGISVFLIIILELKSWTEPYESLWIKSETQWGIELSTSSKPLSYPAVQLSCVLIN